MLLQVYQTYLDRLVQYTAIRWVILSLLTIIYVIRILLWPVRHAVIFSSVNFLCSVTYTVFYILPQTTST